MLHFCHVSDLRYTAILSHASVYDADPPFDVIWCLFNEFRISDADANATDTFVYIYTNDTRHLVHLHFYGDPELDHVTSTLKNRKAGGTGRSAQIYSFIRIGSCACAKYSASGHLLTGSPNWNCNFLCSSGRKAFWLDKIRTRAIHICDATCKRCQATGSLLWDWTS